MSERTPIRTIVHLVRHGEVYNPVGLIYGRLPDYHLSETGRAMAGLVAEHLRGRDVVHLRCSPLERAQETMEPIAANVGLPVTTDGRVIEADNYLEGIKVSLMGTIRRPQSWWLFRNALRPTWGEPYREIVARMRLAIRDAEEEARGHEAVIVSHQLPIWMARCDAEGRRLAHDPRKRECRLASVTSLTLLDGRVASVDYTEPAAELYAGPPPTKFVAGA
ncbi:histidine phosphatase family protein [Microlunatus flavus]|uniref:Broad specificity phosphatase PhoE n=1 Tax=Microlunatus flavus TaxID=1036181 RepID=A0A1H8Z573_9ACTN|nr:histidine phosphatase family protein [Microlunatus flavus]SEP59481.1 Broad specificity phosphatase PhoE [Microlunatus flavus]